MEGHQELYGTDKIVSMLDIKALMIVMLPFAALQWTMVWCLRFIPLPIKNPLVRAITQIIFAGTLSVSAVAQIQLYRSLTGIRVLKNDHFFISTFVGEYVVGICILLTSARELRRKEERSTPD
jgi:hypothetical protein